MNPIIAAGYVEVTDTPQAFFTALIVSVAYISLILIPVFRLRRVGRDARKGAVAVLTVTLLLPLVLREVAVLIQGQSWRDWHLIWLYLIASTLLLVAFHSLAFIRHLLRKKAQPTAADKGHKWPCLS